MRGRQTGSTWAAATLLAALLLPATLAADETAAPEPIDLLGAWHVLVHYTDDNATNDEQLRWLDRLWVFSQKHGKLVWTEYPIVVFGDESGRFERRSSGQYARVLGGWVPNELQRSNIRVGLRTNTRGMKSKKLRGSASEGWATRSRARVGSASVVTYQENWSIAFEDDLPVFAQEDVMGSARSESLAGLTRYTATERKSAGVWVGSYERDGTRRGKLWLRRAGMRRGLDQKELDELLPEKAAE